MLNTPVVITSCVLLEWKENHKERHTQKGFKHRGRINKQIRTREMYMYVINLQINITTSQKGTPNIDD